jgi:hypothetical protein
MICVPNFIIFSGYTWNEKKNNGKGVRRKRSEKKLMEYFV